MDALAEELEVFKGSVSRMRWFMTTAALISVLILLHVYLEQFGFQDHQLETVYSNRIENYVMESQQCLEDLIKKRYAQHNDPGDRQDNCERIPKGMQERFSKLSDEDILKEYSSRRYRITMTDNTIRDAKLQIRRIPLLGVEVPANDFVTVMAMVSLVFVSGVWLNLRALSASLREIAKREDPQILRLAQLNTIFLTAFETTGGHFLVRSIRAMAMWLPFLSISLATAISYGQFFFMKLQSGSPFNFGPVAFILVQLVIALTIMMLHLWIAVECKFVVRDIDAVFLQN